MVQWGLVRLEGVRCRVQRVSGVHQVLQCSLRVHAVQGAVRGAAEPAWGVQGLTHGALQPARSVQGVVKPGEVIWGAGGVQIRIELIEVACGRAF